MRLMLGSKNQPSLLVDVDNDYDINQFKFWVINGCWEGEYTNGYLTIWHPHEPWSSLEKIEILLDNQDRLYGKTLRDYQTVFDKFDDVTYNCKYKPVAVNNDIWDDDIPF